MQELRARHLVGAAPTCTFATPTVKSGTDDRHVTLPHYQGAPRWAQVILVPNPQQRHVAHPNPALLGSSSSTLRMCWKSLAGSIPPEDVPRPEHLSHGCTARCHAHVVLTRSAQSSESGLPAVSASRYLVPTKQSPGGSSVSNQRATPASGPLTPCRCRPDVPAAEPSGHSFELCVSPTQDWCAGSTCNPPRSCLQQCAPPTPRSTPTSAHRFCHSPLSPCPIRS